MTEFYTVPAPFCRSSIIQRSCGSRRVPSVRSDSRSRIHRARVAGLSGASPSRWWRHIGHTQPITGSHCSLQPGCVTVHKGDQEDPGPRVCGDCRGHTGSHSRPGPRPPSTPRPPTRYGHLPMGGAVLPNGCCDGNQIPSQGA